MSFDGLACAGPILICIMEVIDTCIELARSMRVPKSRNQCNWSEVRESTAVEWVIFEAQVTCS